MTHSPGIPAATAEVVRGVVDGADMDAAAEHALRDAAYAFLDNRDWAHGYGAQILIGLAVTHLSAHRHGDVTLPMVIDRDDLPMLRHYTYEVARVVTRTARPA